MLKLDDYEQIRRMHEIEGLSQREIARKLGHSRNTIAKALAHPAPPGYRMSQPRAWPVLEKHIPIIDELLEKEAGSPRKQKMKATHLCKILTDDYKYKGSVHTVRRYLRSRKQHKQEVFVPLAFDPGQEGQVDWHEAVVVINAVRRKVQVFVMRLCYSKASFARAYERANLESFLDGHVHAFNFFGGTPRRLAFDNLKSAVIQVGPGKERVLNDRFKHLRSHYLFDTRFCNVARGNEKGDVENLAKRSEQAYFTPVPEFGSIEELNAHLLKCCDADLDRLGPKPHQDQTIRSLFEQEQSQLLQSKHPDFEACVYSDTRVDKRSLVTVDTNCYSVPVVYAHHDVHIKRFAERVEVWHEGELITRHPRCFEKGQFILTAEHYLAMLKTKPGCLDNARAFKGQPWGEDLERMRRELEYRQPDRGTRQYIDILLLMTQHTVEGVKDAVRVCLRRRAFSYDGVLTVLRNEPVTPSPKLDLSDRPDLSNVDDGTRPLSVYDQLAGGQAAQEGEVAA